MQCTLELQTNLSNGSGSELHIMSIQNTSIQKKYLLTPWLKNLLENDIEYKPIEKIVKDISMWLYICK